MITTEEMVGEIRRAIVSKTGVVIATHRPPIGIAQVELRRSGRAWLMDVRCVGIHVTSMDGSLADVDVVRREDGGEVRVRVYDRGSTPYEPRIRMQVDIDPETVMTVEVME